MLRTIKALALATPHKLWIGGFFRSSIPLAPSGVGKIWSGLPAPELQINKSDEGVKVWWAGHPSDYDVQSNDDLASGPWMMLDSPVQNDQGVSTMVLPATDSAHYFRLRERQ